MRREDIEAHAYERMAKLARPGPAFVSPVLTPKTLVEWVDLAGLGFYEDPTPAVVHESIAKAFPGRLDTAPYQPMTVALQVMRRLVREGIAELRQGGYRAIEEPGAKSRANPR